MKNRKIFAGLGLGILASSMLGGLGMETVLAADAGSVVINEVAWAGSADSSNDEWIELYNTTAASVDLSGWKIRDDGVDAYTFPAGATIAAHGYVLMEDTELVVSTRVADFIYNMSLANTGDSLALVDGGGGVVDTVNGSGGAWYAGSSTTYASMERIDALAGDLAANFAASTGSGDLASAGSAILGTPGRLNSVSVPAADQTVVQAVFPAGSAIVGETVQMVVHVSNVGELFAYGMELNYDPARLQLAGVNPGGFLSEDGTVATSLQSGLKGGVAGDLLVAEARTIDPKVGRAGSGDLFSVSFTVIGGEGTEAVVTIGGGSFISSPSGDLSAGFQPGSLNVVPATVEPVSGLQATTGTERYQIKLNWSASVSAPDLYRVERMDAHGNWQVLGEQTGLEFVDQDGVNHGGKIVPNLAYNYRVTAVKNSLTSEPVMITAQDSRGIKGDNNRSDLIDGRDLERLALHFAETDVMAGFEPLVDTTYDGTVNGSDLIDIGAAFAQSY